MKSFTVHEQHNWMQEIYLTRTMSQSEDSEEELEDYTNMGGSNCTVCSGLRTSTCTFILCRYTNLCADCSQQLIDFGQTCPICRSSIAERGRYLMFDYD